jgi:hypothetical protein
VTKATISSTSVVSMQSGKSRVVARLDRDGAVDLELAPEVHEGSAVRDVLDGDMGVDREAAVDAVVDPLPGWSRVRDATAPLSDERRRRASAPTDTAGSSWG